MRTTFLALATLLSCGCSSGPTTGSAMAQYICPDGHIVQAGYSQDQRLLRLSLQGVTRTLTRNDATGAWSNGNITVTMDARFLHMDRAGHLLTQHCRLQFPAGGATMPSP